MPKHNSHTPGPWHVHSEVTKKDSSIRNKRVVAEDGKGGHFQVAITSARWHPKEVEQQANAQLISAAPDMLAILQEIYNNSGKVSGRLRIRIEDAIYKATK